jgi:hypothetical protein
MRLLADGNASQNSDNAEHLARGDRSSIRRDREQLSERRKTANIDDTRSHGVQFGLRCPQPQVEALDKSGNNVAFCHSSDDLDFDNEHAVNSTRGSVVLICERARCRMESLDPPSWDLCDWARSTRRGIELPRYGSFPSSALSKARSSQSVTCIRHVG